MTDEKCNVQNRQSFQNRFKTEIQLVGISSHVMTQLHSLFLRDYF